MAGFSRNTIYAIRNTNYNHGLTRIFSPLQCKGFSLSYPSDLSDLSNGSEGSEVGSVIEGVN